MFAILVAAMNTVLASVIGPLLVRALMFLGLNIGMEYLLTQITGLSANVFNPFNIGPLINGLLAQIVWPELLWAFSFFNLSTVLALCINAVFANFTFGLMRDLL